MFQTNMAENIKTYILCSIIFSKNRAIYEMCGKIRYSPTGHRWQYYMVHVLCILDNWGCRHSEYVFYLGNNGYKMDLDVVFIPTLPILFFSCGWIRLWPFQQVTKWQRRDEWKRKWGTIDRWQTCLKEYFQNNQSLFFCCNRM
jgi:hypothetical protein